MARKRWSPSTAITPRLLKSREKRKWQIALRRYVLEKNSSLFYAPYFGLDTKNIRRWFEMQFEKETGWDDFGKLWQFDHIIPVIYFDFADEEELKLCWNFTNIRIARIWKDEERGNGLDIIRAKIYFEELYAKTLYAPCGKMLNKIRQMERSQLVEFDKQQAFIRENRAYLDTIANYSMFEFELLNSGKTPYEITKEVAILKKFEN